MSVTSTQVYQKSVKSPKALVSAPLFELVQGISRSTSVSQDLVDRVESYLQPLVQKIEAEFPDLKETPSLVDFTLVPQVKELLFVRKPQNIQDLVLLAVIDQLPRGKTFDPQLTLAKVRGFITPLYLETFFQFLQHGGKQNGTH